MLIQDVEVVWQCLFLNSHDHVTSFRSRRKKSDGSRQWESIKSVLEKICIWKEHEISVTKRGYKDLGRQHTEKN